MPSTDSHGRDLVETTRVEPAEFKLLLRQIRITRAKVGIILDILESDEYAVADFDLIRRCSETVAGEIDKFVDAVRHT